MYYITLVNILIQRMYHAFRILMLSFVNKVKTYFIKLLDVCPTFLKKFCPTFPKPLCPTFFKTLCPISPKPLSPIFLKPDLVW